MNDRVPANGIVRVSNNIERVTTLEDGSVVFKPPPNSFADWDFGRVLNRYVDDRGRQTEVKELSPVEAIIKASIKPQQVHYIAVVMLE